MGRCVIVVLLAGLGVILGAQYNVLSQLNLPSSPVSRDTATTAGIIAGVAALLVSLLGAVLGGMLGTGYHRRIDRVGFNACAPPTGGGPSVRPSRDGVLPEDPAPLVARLRAAGCVFAEEEAAALLAAATGRVQLAALVARRISGEPLELVLGWTGFCGLEVAVEPGVFVPRQRTALLVEQAVALLRRSSRPPVVVDLCCGSGAVGLAVAGALGGVELHAADVDPVAVRCARRNLAPAGGQVHQGDLFSALPAGLRGRVDLLAVNAPYVPSEAVALMPPEARDHEPRAALDGGPDGAEVQRRVAAGARRWLAPDGILLVETSARQAPLTAAAVEGGGMHAVVVRDDGRDATVVVGTSPTAPCAPGHRPR